MADYEALDFEVESDYWLGFSPDHDPDQAIATFVERFGTAPRVSWRGVNDVLLVGPCPVRVDNV